MTAGPFPKSSERSRNIQEKLICGRAEFLELSLLDPRGQS